MESVSKSGVHLSIGAEVTCLFGEGRLKDATLSTVASEAPLYLDCVASNIQRFTFPRKVILVFQEDGNLLRGESEILSAEELEGGKTRLQLSKVVWEDMDRRAFPRVTVELPVSLRAVYESKGDTIISVVEGKTEDVSVGGSKVWVHHPVVAGSLVEFYAMLNDSDAIRALGVVAHSDPKGSIGIAFLDYVGASREKLEEFLESKAA
ncbi:MAG TPA: PilZ domain-containing protein [Fimbriimonas sp.]|nr:PilZ domain-containing protein [Fimbriimonas sp.]